MKRKNSAGRGLKVVLEGGCSPFLSAESLSVTEVPSPHWPSAGSAGQKDVLEGMELVFDVHLQNLS